jgi:hypothetical protein
MHVDHDRISVERAEVCGCKARAVPFRAMIGVEDEPDAVARELDETFIEGSDRWLEFITGEKGDDP